MSSKSHLSAIQIGYVRKVVGELKQTSLGSEEWLKRLVALGRILFTYGFAERIHSICSWSVADGWQQLTDPWQYVRHLLVVAVDKAESDVLWSKIRRDLRLGRLANEQEKGRAAELAVISEVEIVGLCPNLNCLDENDKQSFFAELVQIVERLLSVKHIPVGTQIKSTKKQGEIPADDPPGHQAPPPEPRGVLIEAERDVAIESMGHADRLAYLAYQFAESKAGRPLEDREAFDLLKEEGIPELAGDSGELAGYKLPSFDTFTRYLRKARRTLGEQKHKRRCRPAPTRSIVKGNQIENQSGTSRKGES